VDSPASHLSFSLAASLLACLALEVVPPPSSLPWLLSQTHPPLLFGVATNRGYLFSKVAGRMKGRAFLQRLQGEEPFYKGFPFNKGSSATFYQRLQAMATNYKLKLQRAKVLLL